jgi:hypothetical protein
MRLWGGRPAAAVAAIVFCASWGAARPAAAQLRIVDYNIAENYNIQTDPGGLDDILAAIGAEVRNGIARPLDVLALQESSTNGADAASVAGILNTLYGAGTYAAASVPGNAVSGGNGLPGLVYNTTTVSLIGSPLAFGPTGSGPTQQPRSSLRYQLRPVGYDAAADFYLFNDHYKSDDNSTDAERRRVEAASVRDNADALGEGTHAIYAGDFNVYRDTEPMYVELQSAGPGRAKDPINRPGNWSTSSMSLGPTFRDVHTQSPATVEAFNGQVLQGMDDRFDFQLITDELDDGEGMSIVPGSYRPFGNNGTHTWRQAISTGTGAAGNILTALTQVSDHLPVVADYQLPAKMQVAVGTIPTLVPLGSMTSVNVLVQNIAAALTATSADELDYTLSVTGDLVGGATATANPLAAANSHGVTLNAATPGLKSGMINVVASSQGAAQAMFSMPVSFHVGDGGGLIRTMIAKDDFDAPVNLTSFVQSPTPTTLTGSRGFREYDASMVPDDGIPFALIDESSSTFPTDQQGIINTGEKTDSWFGVAGTVHASNPNPGGLATATWEFNVAGASGLEVSIDMGAMGNFEESGAGADSFDWTYSLDGGAFLPLFTSSVDEDGTKDYTLASGTVIANVPDPLQMTNTANETIELSNVLETITSAIVGVGNTLTIKLDAIASGIDDPYAFDNIVVTGLVEGFASADFNEDGFVDGGDFEDWAGGFGLATGATKGQGDEDNDGDVDGADFLGWQRQFGLDGSAIVASGAAPEPGAMALLVMGAMAWGAPRCGGPSRRG